MKLALVLVLTLVSCETDSDRRQHQCAYLCEPAAADSADYAQALKCIRCLNGKRPRAGGGAAAPDDP